jgi:predicted CopG family antitoxin
MEKLMGKKKFSDILGDLVEKPKGKLSLVPDTDKRKPVDTVFQDFDVIE